MAAPLPPSQSGAVLDGFRFLARRPVWTIGLALAGMVLGQLGPALEIAARAGENPIMGLALTWAAMLPMELYLIPRWIARLDAESIGDSANALVEWPARFDQRWLRAFGLSFAVQALGGLGLVLLLIPGLIVLTLLGFAPLRLLLRGGSAGDALRWSARSMALHWPRIVQAALLILLFAFAGALALALAQGAVFARFGEAGPDAWTRLKHPFIWASQLLSSLALLWISASFLGLYHRLERLAAAVQPR